ncbi:MAG: redoxin family protein [Planctomycetes bacterium]|nr:redoxin family protein [Planctomycetota bacterium]
MRRHSLRAVLAGRLLAALLALTIGFGAAANVATAGEVDKQAEPVLKALTDANSTLKTFRTEITAAFKVQPASGAASRGNLVYAVVGAAPNKLALTPRLGDGPTIIADGEQLYTFMPSTSRYVRSVAPDSIADIAKSNEVQSTGPACVVVSGALLLCQPYEQLVSAIETVTYVGEEKAGAGKAHHLKLTQADFVWDVWIDAGKKPALRRAEVDISRWRDKHPDALPAEAKVETQLTFKTVTGTPAAKDKDFAIVPPPTAKEVASFAPGEKEDSPQLLKDKPAPAFQAALLSGGAVSSSQLLGKQVVILDFWATWCPYCVKSLPGVAEVAAAYRSKGVSVVAVNVKEDAPTVMAFMREKQIDIPVAMDTDGALSKRYRASGLPQLVIIDRAGKVRIVHQGAPADVKEVLSRELDMILAVKTASN